jgi:mono/diheme cytochrome c family protein
MRIRVVSAILVLAVAGAVIVVAGLLRRGISARHPPGSVETFVARQMRHWATPSAMRDAKNPIAATPDVLAEGRAHFADHCASCHGNDGKGQTELGRAMFPPAPDMTRPATQSLSDGEIFSIIANGVRMTGMPAWGDGSEQSQRDTWHLVHFIRHLPAITAAEIEEMEALNPRSPAEMKEMKAEEEFLKGR